MTTRAGLVGLGTGMVLSAMLFYPLYFAWPDGLCTHAAEWPGSTWVVGGLLAAAVILIVFCGGMAAAWSGAAQVWQRVWLGALAGGLAALTLFSSLGAAAGGAPGLASRFASIGSPGMEGGLATETILQITNCTHRMFWGLMLGGVALGALGGWRFAPQAIKQRAPTPSKNDPMMALNASITAMPAAAFAVMLVVGLFSRLPGLLQHKLVGAEDVPAQPLQVVLNWPLTTAMLLYLAGQLALMLATAHEAGQAEHRCGIDEVKMAAYVGIFVPILLIIVLGLLNSSLLFTPFILSCLALSLGMAARQVVVLHTVILPRRAQMQAPQDAVEAAFFGTIATSRWQSLSLLCLGCGVMMAAPTYIALAAGISITFIPVSVEPVITSATGVTAPTLVDLIRRLYGVQAAAGLGSSGVAALMLMGMYLFYNNLGRWFRDRREKRLGHGSEG